ncbi:biotin transporter BioY [Oceanobacillus chungangensis]|uniref:Biotin transporter n=1 Tax=Oceanobacillus chungangensis TaxID=1229152 RepID=A0A3D8PWL3_9BACI|nr:biotin transporter BioY [Oceanobacillus chungangensis]RDW19711.1 biotin transporter BioY [Oceanobacillus chungangensis]
MKIQKLAYVSLFAAIMGVLGLMPAIPLGFTPVPITPQTLGVMLAGSVLGARLGPKYAAYSQLLFLLLVAAGLPLLSGGRGGLGVFAGPGSGYLFGWIAGAYVIGLVCYKMKEMNLLQLVLANVAGGMIVVYLFGIPFQAMMMNITILDAFIVNLVFLPGDFIKVMVGSLLAVKLQKAIPVFKEEAKAA